MDSQKNKRVKGKKAGEEMRDWWNKYNNGQMCVSKDSNECEKECNIYEILIHVLYGYSHQYEGDYRFVVL